MAAKHKKTPAFEAAYGLFIMGMEVGKADGEIDREEVTILLAQCQAAAAMSKSALVRDASRLAAQYEELKAYREEDSRNHMEVVEDLKKFLKKQSESDRMRYLATMLSIGKGVAEASGGGWFSDGPASQEEKTILAGLYVIISEGLEIDKLNSWISAHGI